MRNLKKGFTLIELLIVIAILGVLAVGLFAALDPIEQMAKARDASARSTMGEFIGAMQRYYVVRQSYPPSWGANINSSLATGTGLTSVRDLTTMGELKTDFTTRAGAFLDNIRIMGSTAGGSVCLSSESKAFRNDVNAKYNVTTGAIVATCPSATNSFCGICGSL